MTGVQISPSPARKMRANRKVVGSRCTTCSGAFDLAQEVYACAECSGFHHTTCRKPIDICSALVNVVAPLAVSTASAPIPAHAESTVQEMLHPEAHAVALSEAEASTVATQESIASPETQLAPDEQYCSQCSKVIKRAALKCRFCGHVFDPVLEKYIGVEKIPDHLMLEIDSAARKSLVLSIISLFIFAPFIAPFAITNGRKAIRLLDQYPRVQSSARRKARSGIVIGWIALAFFLIYVFGRMFP